MKATEHGQLLRAKGVCYVASIWEGVETTLNRFDFMGPLKKKLTTMNDGIPLLGGSSQLVSGYEPVAFGLPKFLALWLTTEMFLRE